MIRSKSLSMLLDACCQAVLVTSLSIMRIKVLIKIANGNLLHSIFRTSFTYRRQWLHKSYTGGMQGKKPTCQITTISILTLSYPQCPMAMTNYSY